MKSIKEIDGRFWRKTTDDVWANTVFGKRELKKFRCKTCREVGYVSEAYLDSKRKDRIRPYHATCWNAYNGKTFRSLIPSNDAPSATLDNFYNES
jgi:hypothetical protein